LSDADDPDADAQVYPEPGEHPGVPARLGPVGLRDLAGHSEARRQDDGAEVGRCISAPAEGGTLRPDGGPQRAEEPRGGPGPGEATRRNANEARGVAEADERPVAHQGSARVGTSTG